MAQNMKLKVLTLITKLSDRDTYTTAAAELESLARGLDSSSSIATFLNCVLSAGPNDKLPARKQCLYLINILSFLYAGSVAALLPKILGFLTRRVRDPDSSIIRPQCASTTASLAKNLTKVSFFDSFVKPLSEALFTEQEVNSLLGIAMCLSAAVEATTEPEPSKLGKFLLPKLDRVLKNEGYKGKQGGLTVLSSVIVVGGVEGYSGLSELVGSLIGFLKSDDWATRKASAEALKRLAVAEKAAMAEHKSFCVKIFESRRFDKVKATREVMNQMIEAWKQVPDVSEETSPPPRSVVSSGDDTSDGKHRSKSSENARNRINFNRKNPKTTTRVAMNEPPKRRNRLINCKDEAANLKPRRNSKPDRSKILSNKNSEDDSSSTMRLKSATCEPAPENRNKIHDINQEGEELSSIRSQLVQIQRQQTHLFDLLQSFMGNSQNGIRTIERRVHGLETAMDDLALSDERMAEPRRMSCCLLPGTNPFNPKLKGISRNYNHLECKRNESQSSSMRRQSTLGLIVNPLAELSVDSRGTSIMTQGQLKLH